MSEEEATLEGQFSEFAKMNQKGRSGETITLSNSDYWMRQAKILTDRKLTMTDTGVAFTKFSKSEISYDEWLRFLSDVCENKNMDEETTKQLLTNCGLPGTTTVNEPQYRAFFDTFKPKEKIGNS